MADEQVTLGELVRAMTRIERKLDENIDDHEKRLRVVERWMWTALGTGVAGAGMSLLALFGPGAGG